MLLEYITKNAILLGVLVLEDGSPKKNEWETRGFGGTIFSGKANYDSSRAMLYLDSNLDHTWIWASNGHVPLSDNRWLVMFEFDSELIIELNVGSYMIGIIYIYIHFFHTDQRFFQNTTYDFHGLSDQGGSAPLWLLRRGGWGGCNHPRSNLFQACSKTLWWVINR